MLRGSCHCGAVEIQVERKPRRLTSCNCSICRRHAGLLGYYDKGKVKVVARRGALDHYVWGGQVPASLQVRNLRLRDALAAHRPVETATQSGHRNDLGERPDQQAYNTTILALIGC